MTNENGKLGRLDNRAGHYALLILVAALLTLPNLGAPSLWDIDEGHNAEAALEMQESGNYVTPTFNYEMRSDKPALLYWLQAGCYRLFGVGEFGARLPSALAALLTVLLTYELGRRLFGRRTALLGGLILASAVLFCAAGHFAKGPVGLLLPAAVICVFLIRCGRWRQLLDSRLLLGVLTFLLVTLPWCILVGAETKAHFLKEFMAKHNLGRYHAPMEGHAGGIYYYFLVLFAGFVPWSILLVPALRYAWKGEGDEQDVAAGPGGTGSLLTLAAVLGAFYGGIKGYAAGIVAYKGPGNEGGSPLPGSSIADLLLPLVGMMLAGAVIAVAVALLLLLMVRRWRATQSERPATTPIAASAGLLVAPATAYRFLWCWIGVYIVFFSLSGTKLPNYILPIYPAVALFIARFLERWWSGAVAIPDRRFQFCLALLAPLGIGIALGFLVAGGAIELPGLWGRYLPGLQSWALLGTVPVLGGAAASWCLRRQLRGGVVLSLAAMAVVFAGVLAAWGGMAVDAFKAPRPLVQSAGADDTGREIRVGCYQYYQPSLVFYCRRGVWNMQEEREPLEFMRCPLQVYLFVPEAVWQELAGKVGAPCRLLASHYDLYRNCRVVVVTNR
jgi:4-amino-4-deoxy-L-arabinose transferase-like glycosyltransferase